MLMLGFVMSGSRQHAHRVNMHVYVCSPEQGRCVGGQPMVTAMVWQPRRAAAHSHACKYCKLQTAGRIPIHAGSSCSSGDVHVLLAQAGGTATRLMITQTSSEHQHLQKLLALDCVSSELCTLLYANFTHTVPLITRSLIFLLYSPRKIAPTMPNFSIYKRTCGDLCTVPKKTEQYVEAHLK